jgi:hypothetical protein
MTNFGQTFDFGRGGDGGRIGVSGGCGEGVDARAIFVRGAAVTSLTSSGIPSIPCSVISSAFSVTCTVILSGGGVEVRVTGLSLDTLSAGPSKKNPFSRLSTFCSGLAS